MPGSCYTTVIGLFSGGKESASRWEKLKKLDLPKSMMVNFYTTIIVFTITIWYASEKVIGHNMPSLQDPYGSRTLQASREDYG